MALCLCNAYIAFTEFMMLQAGDPQTALFWLKVYTFWSLVIAISIHFLLIYTGKGHLARRWWVWALIYAPFLAISFTTILSETIYTNVVLTNWGYQQTHNPETNIGLMLYMPAVMAGMASMVVAIVFHHRQKDPILKRQAAFVALGYLAPNLLGVISGLSPYFTDTPIPSMTAYGAALQEIFIGLAIWRYNLFELNPATAAGNIITTMSDMLLITNANTEIVSINRSLTDKLGYAEGELLNQPITAIIGPGKAQNLFRIPGAEKANGKKVPADGLNIGHYDSVLVTRGGNRVPVGIAVSILNERDGRTAGYVVIARDMTDWKKAEQEKNDLIKELQTALANIKTLKGLIPICAHCQKIRNDQGYWQRVEEYVSEHTEADFSHSLCEECLHILYPDFIKSGGVSNDSN
jgi:PAS domain S-box-containing protein